MSQSQSRFLATSPRAGAVVAAVLVVLPGFAEAECVTQPGRVLMSPAAPAAAAAAPRAAMLRARPALAGAAVAAPSKAARPKVARAQKPISAGRASATGKRKATRAPSGGRSRALAAARVAGGGPAVAKPALRPVIAPVPMIVAAQELAVPKAYALVALTVCHSGVIEPIGGSAPDVSSSGLPVFEEGLLDDALSWPGGERPLDPFVATGPTPPRLVDPTLPGPTLPGPALPGDVGAVPEPSTWAMMIGGFGLIGAALRRRRLACRP